MEPVEYKGSSHSGSEGEDVWRPTGGVHSDLDEYLNQGLFNTQPVYIHNTSADGWAGINNSGMLGAAPDHTRRGQQAKSGVYLCKSTQAFSPAAAHTLLFFEDEKYRHSSTHCVVFAHTEGLSVTTAPVSHGSWVQETIHRGNIPLEKTTVLYSGPNPFVSLTRQNHLMKGYDPEDRG